MVSNRRQMLLQTLHIGAFALPMLSAKAETTQSSGRLVLVFLRGAYDGLSMLVPHGDPHYVAIRPNIAIPKPDGTLKAALPLDDTFGLHPAVSYTHLTLPTKRIV